MKAVTLTFLSLALFVFIWVPASRVAAQTNIFPATGPTGIGTLAPNPSSLLDVTSSSKGILIPRMTKVQRDAIAAPATGLLIYQINNTPGFYYYSGTAWIAISTKGANTSLSNLAATTAINNSLLAGLDSSIDLGSPSKRWKGIYAGNASISNDMLVNGITVGRGGGSVFGNTAIGPNALAVNTSGYYNTANGFEAMAHNTDGYENTANGFQALSLNTTGYGNTANGLEAIYANTIGFNNVAAGSRALFSNTTGNGNAALGSGALRSNISGSSNVAIGINALASDTVVSNLVAIGDSALYLNTSGEFNVAVGSKALYSNSTGAWNVANGYQALYSNTTGFDNIANGYQALYHNTTGGNNVANGYQALYSNQTGTNNIANGIWSLAANINGSDNVATGYQALDNNVYGSNNIATGNSALFWNSGSSNIAIGVNSLHDNSSGNFNVAVGESSFATNQSGSNNSAFGSLASVASVNLNNATAIGFGATVNASNKVVIGNNSVTVIGGKVSWSTLSDGRFKNNIKENVPGLDFIKKLRPVTYNLQLQEFDKFLGKKDSLIKANAADYAREEKKLHTGFVAQEVEKAAKELNYDFDGVNHPQNDKDNYSLAYADFVPSLVKAVQQLSKMNEEKDAKISDLESRISKLEATLSNATVTSNSTVINNLNSATIFQNVPNPFRTSTTISYSLPQNCSSAKIIVTDKSGKALKEIKLPVKGSGTVNLDAATLASGAYQYALYVDGKLIDSKQMVLAK